MDRGNRYILLLAAFTGALIASLLVLGQIAHAYPTGWTSDKVVTNDNVDQVDIAAKGSNVYAVWRTNTTKQIHYSRSTDKGVTWSSPVRVDLGDQIDGDSYPQVCTGQGNTVYVGYVSEERSGSTGSEILLRRSQDNGASWDSGYWDYAQLNEDGSFLSFTRGPTDSPALCYQRNYQIFWRKIIPAGLGGELRASQTGSWMQRSGRIATDGTVYFIAYYDDPGSGNPVKIVCNRYTGTDNWDTLATAASVHYLRYPDITYENSGYFNVSWTDDTGTSGTRSWSIKSTEWISAGGWHWDTPANLYNGNSDDPSASKVLPPIGTVVCRNNTKTGIERAGYDITLMASCNPLSDDYSAGTDGRSLAVNGDGYPYLAAATTSRTLMVKRVDGTPPTGSVNAPGYASHNINVSFTASDDWNVTGSDPLGDSFTNGVTSIKVAYGPAPGGPWTDSATLNNAPWQASIPGLAEGTWYAKGILTDTAGNASEAISGPIVMDNTNPTVSITSNSSPNSAGWDNKPVTVTITGQDSVALDRCEYSVGEGNWQPYTVPILFFNDGQCRIDARSVDGAGNISATETLLLKVDTNAPTCFVMKPSGDIMKADRFNKVFISGSATDSASGVTWIGIYIDGRLVAEGNGGEQGYSWDVTNEAEKTYTIEVRSKDRAGNSSVASKSSTLQNGKTLYSDSYFAEGTTRPGFDEYLCVLNPDDKNEANLTIDFQLETGQTISRQANVAAGSRTTFNVADMVPAGHDVSTKIHSEGAYVIAERPMYFNYQGKWTGGHTASARNTLQREFYFAEGTTRAGFDEWLTLQNPGNSDATADVSYMLGSGGNINRKYAVPAHTRITVNVNSEVGAGQDVSVHLTSDQPISAERPMYFNYQGKWTGGHDVIGATSPSQTWYFAEGTTRPGFDEYLCIQNPNDGMADVEVRYSTGDSRKYSIGPRSRYTVYVNGDVGADKDVAATITSSLPVICERPMYFDYRGWTGGSDALGAVPSDGGSTDYYFAEGTTRGGFSEYLTIANLYQSQGKVYITYVLSDGSEIHKQMPNGTPFIVVPAGERQTIDVAADVGLEKDVSVRIESEYPIVIERPMYFNYQGVWTGGHVGVPSI